MNDDFKLPRLFIDAPLNAGGAAPLSADQAHYLKNVLRRADGDMVRVFNGRDGEWRGPLEGLSKKGGSVCLDTQTRPQPAESRRIHLYFAPIKKHAMDWLIEKAVELGATDLHPIITQNTEVRKINADRLKKQVFEAAEQCERLEIPVLHDLSPLNSVSEAKIPVFSCIERENATEIGKSGVNNGDIALLIGPEGGFTADEKALLTKNPQITPVSLGETVLRAETAVCYALIVAQIS